MEIDTLVEIAEGREVKEALTDIPTRPIYVRYEVPVSKTISESLGKLPDNCSIFKHKEVNKILESLEIEYNSLPSEICRSINTLGWVVEDTKLEHPKIAQHAKDCIIEIVKEASN